MVWFDELSQTRAAGMNGPSAITYQEFVAWKLAYARPVSTYETRLLFVLDRWFRAAAHEAAERERRRAQRQTGRTR